MRDGECWEQIPLGLVTIEKEFGYWPTPTATDWKATGKLENYWKRQRQTTLRSGGQRQNLNTTMPGKYNMKMPVGSARDTDDVAFRVDRLKAIGNGQVPLCAATAWRILNDQI